VSSSSKDNPPITKEKTTPPITETPTSHPPVPKEEKKRRKLSRSKKMRTGISVPTSLSKIKVADLANKQEKKDKHKEDVVFELDTSVQIDKEKFLELLRKVAKKYKEKGKVNIAMALVNSRHELNHNEWILTVENDIYKTLLDTERDFLGDLREILEVPNLYMKIRINEKVKNYNESIPYTEEDKLKVIAEKNPLVFELKRIFKARIIYPK